MGINFGSDKIKEIYVGSDKIKEVYHGGDLVWSGEDTRGYWVHYQTGIKTYFGLDENYIQDGSMSNPPWRYNASEIKIPLGVTKTESETLYGISMIVKVIIPSSMMSIGNWSFDFCSNLQVFICLAVNPPNASGSFLYGVHSALQIYVPPESVQAYKTAPGWSDHSSKIQGY